MYPSNRTFQHTLLFNNDTTNNPSDSKLDYQDPSISSSLFHFPSLYEEAVTELTWQQLHDLFFHQQSFDQTVLNISMAADLPKTNNASDVNESRITTEKMNITRKRTSKKDRHSKINTAHGPRDRRMRLSLEVARKFFDLQDTLGFDKASKTVEWLLTQSNYAIKEVMGNMPLARGTGGGGGGGGTANSVSSTTSECEAVSGIDESGTTNENQPGPASISVKLKIKNKEKKACRTALHKVARESRKNARERARKRTMEKKRFINNGQEIMDHSYLLNRSSYEESGGGIQLGAKFNNHQSNSYDQGLKEAVDYAAAADHSNLGNWNFPQNAHEISHEQHFTSDFDNYCGKPWEATCNNL
ncbi:hypothetical protein M9H77_28947 [Catharanthus roseus]|uniref:Uncharacterized protein n=1 Tax=Catharanthus roseus TaxID=4058 RepID=A0ACC0AHR4_CATRO|nr:hypothetical protein M9H77_28947 [Catharanthus roseus]